MKILLTDAGKRFNRDWIFRHLSTEFNTGNAYAITGPNGSGKSTLLQLLAGALQQNEGQCLWYNGNAALKIEEVHQQVSLCAPYLELIEEMTLTEFLEFHSRFKSFIDNFSTTQIISLMGLEHAAGKQIRYFSSGMKQRVKLAQCIFSNTSLVLLDEPCTNLDTAGIALYKNLVAQYCTYRLVIVSSNDPVEYSFCNKIIAMSDYK